MGESNLWRKECDRDCFGIGLFWVIFGWAMRLCEALYCDGKNMYYSIRERGYIGCKVRHVEL